MMGCRQVEQAALFYEFSLERHVPADHLLRSIDRFVEFGELRRELAAFYSTLGRPSIDPELMIRMLIVGYCFGIRSERRLCEEAHLNLAYRWFCRLGLDGHVPDHSTFSKNRHGRFRESDLLRRVFETVLRRCIREGLVGGEAFAIDASLIKADANRQKGIEGEKGLPSQATSRAVKEYLAVLDDEAFGAATDVVPKFVSPADPAARWTGAHGGQAFFAYSTNYLIDVDNGIIVDVEATTAIRQAEVLAAKRMIERSIDRFDLYPARLLGDSAYGSAEMLGWLVYQHGIEPHVTVFDKSTRQMAPSHAMISATTMSATSILAPPARCSPRLAHVWTERHYATAQASMTAKPVASSLDAVQRSRPGTCRDQSMKAPATWHARSQARGKAAPRDDCARKLKCCSPISNAFSSSIGSD
jgi:transposase